MREGKPPSRLLVGRSLIEHSEVKGRGVLALDFIEQGAIVLRYTGELIDEEEEARRGDLDGDNASCYVFGVDSVASTESATTDEQKLTTWVVYYARRDILPGEELTIDYVGAKNPTNLEKQKERQKGECLCNSGPFCRGWVI